MPTEARRTAESGSSRLRPAGVEAAQRDAAGALELAEQEAGDEEARDDEEDVDADVAAGEEGQPGVAEQHGDDRDARRPSMSGRKPVSVGSCRVDRGSDIRERSECLLEEEGL